MAYQADLLKDLDNGQRLSLEAVAELLHTADLSLLETKQTSAAICCLMVTMMVSKRYLWLSLLGIKESEKSFLLDATLSPTGYFDTAIETVVGNFREA